MLGFAIIKSCDQKHGYGRNFKLTLDILRRVVTGTDYNASERAADELSGNILRIENYLILIQIGKIKKKNVCAPLVGQRKGANLKIVVYSEECDTRICNMKYFLPQDTWAITAQYQCHVSHTNQ